MAFDIIIIITSCEMMYDDCGCHIHRGLYFHHSRPKRFKEVRARERVKRKEIVVSKEFDFDEVAKFHVCVHTSMYEF